MVGRRIFILVTLLLAFSLAIFAGTTGKIRGKVVDAETGEPLAGASVMIQDTSLGSYTDSEGTYFILQVSPGTYNVKCNIVGYATKIKKGVRVSADTTTTVDFDMEQKIAGKEEVVVEAKRPLVEKSDTQSGGSMTSEQLSKLSGASVQAVESLQAGAVETGSGDTHFRGGRGGETNYLIDGVPATNAITGERNINIEAGDIQEVKVITGGFNAEYGEAQSGVVNIITKEPTREFHFSVSGETRVGDYTHFGPPIYSDEVSRATGETYTPIYDYNDETGNPIYADTSWSKDYGDKMEPYYQAKASMSGYVPGLPLTFRLSGLYNKDGSYLPNQYRYNYYLFGKLRYKPTDEIDVKYTFVGDNDDGKLFWAANKWNQYKTKTENYRYNNNLKVTHTLSSNTYYYVGAALFKERSDLGSSVIFSELEPDQSLEDVMSYWDYSQNLSTPSIYYYKGAYPYARSRKQQYITVRGALTSQINNYHQIQTGGTFKAYDIELMSVQPFSETNTYYSHYNEQPVKFAYYLQDKAEYGNIIFNVGLRLQGFNSNAQVPKDRKKVWMDGDEEYGTGDNHIRNPEDATTKMKLAPRFAVSFPLTDRDVMHIQYGHFYQIPNFDLMYDNYQYDMSGAYPFIGNPDLEYEKTVSYEIGFDHQVNDWLAISGTIYSKDISNLVNAKTVVTQRGSSYTYYYNNDYGNSRGFELALEKRYSHHISGNLSYTFSIAQGNSSSTRQGYDYMYAGWTRPSKTTYLAWDKRNVLSANVDIRWPDNWGVNFNGKWSSGAPYTPPTGRGETPDPNSERFDSQLNLDMRADKDINIGDYNINLYLDVSNLLNLKRINTDAISTGYAGQLLGDNDGDPLYTYHNFDDPNGYYDSPHAYLAPREIIIGAQVSF